MPSNFQQKGLTLVSVQAFTRLGAWHMVVIGCCRQHLGSVAFFETWELDLLYLHFCFWGESHAFGSKGVFCFGFA